MFDCARFGLLRSGPLIYVETGVGPMPPTKRLRSDHISSVHSYTLGAIPCPVEMNDPDLLEHFSRGDVKYPHTKQQEVAEIKVTWHSHFINEAFSASTLQRVSIKLQKSRKKNNNNFPWNS